MDEGFDGGEVSCDPALCDYDYAGCFSAIDVTFGNCTQTGHTGPSQAQCDSSYANTDLAGTVTVTAGFQRWTVPYSGTYTVEVWGAQGGNHNFGPGGLGARVKGDFDLVQGDVLEILVGQKGGDGTSYNVGGGGGTYVALDDDTPLIIAGGGGGNGGNGGGGGGGYAGGNGGGSLSGTATGFGGESYNDGANPEGQDAVRQGHGQVHITLVP